jgi:hypothetical protein
MSTAFRPTPQGNPLSIDITGARAATPELGLNARRVISKRYSLKDAQGNPVEEWADVVRRVVGHVSEAETEAEKRDEFYAALSGIMLRREFVPNTPCLVNAGKPGRKACRARRAGALERVEQLEGGNMTNETNITHRDLWIALFSAVIAGSAASSGVPGALAERAREIADEAVQLIVSRWPDLPTNYPGPRK